MKRTYALLFALVAVIGLSAQANATLLLRGTDALGNNLIYDTDYDITWYDYTNDLNTWQSQMDWADALTVDFGGTIYSDWRLPTALNQDGTGPCSGYDCTGSEMGHLFFTELGNTEWSGLANIGDFQNLINRDYWSGTEYVPYPSSYNAWAFGFNYARQGINNKDTIDYAIAVRPGDVAAAAVPEPGTMLLLGSGLVGLTAFRKRLGRIHR